MSEKDFNVQCTAQVGCTHKKKEDPSSEESSFEISITFGFFIATPNIVEIVHKAIALIINFIIAHLRYEFK